MLSSPLRAQLRVFIVVKPMSHDEYVSLFTSDRALNGAEIDGVHSSINSLWAGGKTSHETQTSFRGRGTLDFLCFVLILCYKTQMKYCVLCKSAFARSQTLKLSIFKNWRAVRTPMILLQMRTSSTDNSGGGSLLAGNISLKSLRTLTRPRQERKLGDLCGEAR